jgi:outer membrane receptor protein involved in Fe transport
MYVEVFAPIVSEEMDIPFIHKFSAEGAFRVMDNSFAGKDNAWTAGLNFAPISDVELRASATRSVRAPAVRELFSAVNRTFSFAIDPCDGKNNSADEVAQANRVKNCAADGIDRSTFVSSVGNASVSGETGGNLELENEIADSYSVGLVFSPRWVEGLNVAIDAVNIEIEDAIEVFNLTDLMQGCYDSSEFPNDFCSTFRREANGQVAKNDAFTSGYVNAGQVSFKAISLDLDYGFGIGSYGDMQVGAYVYLPQKYEITKLGTTDDDLGEPGNADIQATFTIDWSMDDFGVTLSPRYIGEVVLNNDDFRTYVPASGDTPEQKISRDILDLGDEWYIDLGARYQVSEHVMIRGTVSNLFDNVSSPAAVASGNDDLYNNIGRYMTVSVDVKF